MGGDNLMDDWYLILRTPGDGVHVYPIADDSPGSAALRDAQLAAASSIHSVPNDWVNVSGWDMSVTQGEPHPSLLATANVHEDPPSAT